MEGMGQEGKERERGSGAGGQREGGARAGRGLRAGGGRGVPKPLREKREEMGGEQRGPRGAR